MNLIVLDTETSDLPERGGSMVELAWIKLDEITTELNTKVWEATSSYEAYIQYEGFIDPRAQAQHHIRADQLTAERGAVPREKAVAQLLSELGPDSFLVAHNSDFDSKFLSELVTPWICTYRTAKIIWPEAPGHSNQVLRYWLGIKPDLSIASNIKQRAPHQALYDVATTIGILQKMLEKHTPAELYDMMRPQLLKRMEFGKHKGVEFQYVPLDYMRWLRGQNNLSPDLKLTLDHYLHHA